MKYFIIDLAHRLHIPLCDGCGKWVKGWQRTLSFEVPVCESCTAKMIARAEAKNA